MAFAIVSRDEILALGAAGRTSVGGSQALTEQSPFRVASVSKTFAAGLTGVMVNDGRLDWNDPLTEHVPQFRLDGDAGLITLRHVLGQSSGLIPHAYDNLVEDGMALDQIIPQFGKLGYLCPPGQCYSYQNIVFSLVQPAIERAAETSYDELLVKRIFKPLNMTNASVGFEAFLADPERARPHVKRFGRWETVEVLPHYYRLAPASGVNASILDMAKWLQAMLGARPDVIPDQVRAELTRPGVATKRELYRKDWDEMLTEAHYGLGWRVYRLGEETIAYHSGWVSGYRADAAWCERLGLGIAVLLNFESRMINELTTRFWREVLAQTPQVPPQS